MTDHAPEATPDLLEVAMPGTMCVACGYPLDGLDVRGRCPECGEHVARSIHLVDLAYAPPADRDAVLSGLGGLRRAGWIALAGLAMVVAGFELRGTIAGPRLAMFATVFGTAVLLCALGYATRGVWVLTGPDLAGHERRSESLRRMLRYGSLAACVIALASISLFALAGVGVHIRPRMIARHGLIAWMVFAMLPVGVVAYLQLLADRVRAVGRGMLGGVVAACMLPLALTPAALTFGGDGVYRLLGVPAQVRLPRPAVFGIADSYGWPILLAAGIAAMLAGVACFARGLDRSMRDAAIRPTPGGPSADGPG
ncbi:MAG: hypothetical protein AAFX79_09955 [Planctomycetota bacterium]